MDKSKTFQDLIVWQKTHEFVLLVYNITKEFPNYELYGVTSQFRRAAVSVATNIAEGYKKKDYKSKINFLNIAHSSLEECRYYLILTKDLGYQNDQSFDVLVDEVGKLLNGYAKAIKLNNHSPNL